MRGLLGLEKIQRFQCDGGIHHRPAFLYFVDSMQEPMRRGYLRYRALAPLRIYSNILSWSSNTFCINPLICGSFCRISFYPTVPSASGILITMRTTSGKQVSNFLCLPPIHGLPAKNQFSTMLQQGFQAIRSWLVVIIYQYPWL